MLQKNSTICGYRRLAISWPEYISTLFQPQALDLSSRYCEVHTTPCYLSTDPTKLAALCNRLPLNPKLHSQPPTGSSFLPVAPPLQLEGPPFKKNPLEASSVHEITNFSKLGINLQEEQEAQEEGMRRLKQETGE